MCNAKRTVMMLAVALTVTSGLWAQRGGMGMNPMAGIPTLDFRTPLPDQVRSIW